MPCHQKVQRRGIRGAAAPVSLGGRACYCSWDPGSWWSLRQAPGCDGSGLLAAPSFRGLSRELLIRRGELQQARTHPARSPDWALVSEPERNLASGATSGIRGWGEKLGICVRLGRPAARPGRGGMGRDIPGITLSVAH